MSAQWLHPEVMKKIDPYSPSVKCAWCGLWIIADVFRQYGRMPEEGVLIACKTCGGLSIATREILDRLNLDDVCTMVEVASTRIDLAPSESLDAIEGRLGDDVNAASITEESWLDLAHKAGLHFADYMDLYRNRYSADSHAAAGGQSFEEWLDEHRRVDGEGRMSYPKEDA